MKIDSYPVQKYYLTDLANLDPVTVIVENYEVGEGRIIIECYGECWTHYWNAMDASVEEFISICGKEYLTNKLFNPRDPKSKYAYLERIVAAVQEAFLTLKAGFPSKKKRSNRMDHENLLQTIENSFGTDPNMGKMIRIFNTKTDKTLFEIHAGFQGFLFKSDQFGIDTFSRTKIISLMKEIEAMLINSSSLTFAIQSE